jgi:hypothetical protein
MDEPVQEKALLFNQVKQVFLRMLERQLNYGRPIRRISMSNRDGSAGRINLKKM